MFYRSHWNRLNETFSLAFIIVTSTSPKKMGGSHHKKVKNATTPTNSIGNTFFVCSTLSQWNRISLFFKLKKALQPRKPYLISIHFECESKAFTNTHKNMHGAKNGRKKDADLRSNWILRLMLSSVIQIIRYIFLFFSLTLRVLTIYAIYSIHWIGNRFFHPMRRTEQKNCI